MKKSICITLFIIFWCVLPGKVHSNGLFEKIAISCHSLFTSPRNFVFKKIILNNSAALLQYNCLMSGALNKRQEIIDVESPEAFIEKYKRVVWRISLFNPLFLLLECTDPFGCCELGRFTYPEKRRLFEDYVCDRLVDIAKQKRRIEYVSFGSGFLFQDFVVLTKFLEKEPSAHVNIHCIDVQYNAYLDVQNYLAKQEKTLEQALMETTRELVKEEKDEEKIKGTAKILLINYLQISAMEKQFVGFLRSVFPEAQVSLNLYKSDEQYQSYMSFIERVGSQYPAPDIIVASDIYNEIDLWQKSEQHYIKLCTKGKKENPEMQNVILHGQGLLSYKGEKIDFIKKFQI